MLQKVKAVSTSDLLASYRGDKNVIGFMSIPSRKIKNQIYNGYGDNGQNMLYEVSTMKPEQVMGAGNYASAVHYMDGNTVFHNLHNVNFGDMVYLTDLNLIYKYRVTKKIGKKSPYNTDVIKD
ncbi:class A sortase [Companilactobacillus sp.]|jgi:sortase A|uniref:class A sortase n=1 Tax=Companilactobacillus sp. TaxID=2767905 RepID=UPI0025BCB3DF|nr:class A sortase [Companilactobacillus sp.]MCH4009495.1 class A sortase [Companilactobacillus sp.]MCH4052829.1 class A sortase [Companilactobacillus sp.]MCH4077437.1 class A sortase [Companilactobacillus sp.]MCH4126013.1 class A sortase [Companilactobacillus sp.]MCI1311721.1 class A sortase [Companilactobacillus sp.]